jgi:RNA polymerase sigma-70 factor (ECF subfamily)
VAGEAEGREVLGAIGEAIESELSPHQREVLIAVALNDVPIDVLAERLNTSRGALYKTVHDARRKLRAHLADAGLRFTAAERR